MNSDDVNSGQESTAKGEPGGARPAYRSRSEYGRPSERIFRRSRASRARRKAEDKSDFRFISLILQLCVLGALAMVGLGVMAQKKMAGGAIDLSAVEGLAAPWLGSLSKIEVGGIALIMAVSALLLWRWRRRGS